ncbi:hypothetical protein [Streptomyces rimosus]|uniref:hypothetical protein n=1 Tax=Streptomyces rimosus TaxID=1927 RepID=UPI00131B4168|nr:hypothetical protein [Streptomyces rimosus]
MLRTVCLMLAIGVLAAAAGLVPQLFAREIGTGPALRISVVTARPGHQKPASPGCRHRMAPHHGLPTPARCRPAACGQHPRPHTCAAPTGSGNAAHRCRYLVRDR